MQVAEAIAAILKQEGVKFIVGYPVNPIIEAAAEADIRTIIVRQERVGLHMADAVSRLRAAMISESLSCSMARALKTPLAALLRRTVSPFRFW